MAIIKKRWLWSNLYWKKNKRKNISIEIKIEESGNCSHLNYKKYSIIRKRYPKISRFIIRIRNLLEYDRDLRKARL